MKFSPIKDDSIGFKHVNGVYFAGSLQQKLCTDLVDISEVDIDLFKVLINGGNGINGLSVEVEGFDGDAVLYAWKSNRGVVMICNPGFEALWFRGFIVDKSDKDAVEYASKCFEEKRQIL